MAAETVPLSPAPHYPVHVDAADQPAVSRWLWLVKWLLAIPHFLVLAVLWVVFVALSLVALVGILVTGRYPRAIFAFNVGVLRWSWRVAYYSYGALATDRYPPFSLDDDPSYPAHLEVDYPEHLSRGLALVKWWLLALPHYVVVGLFLGTGAWVAYDGGGDPRWVWGSGLVGILVLVAAVVVLFTGAYPRPVYDLLLGINRWALRVAAYAALMTDDYPPFRLDQGPHDPDGVVLRTDDQPAPATGGHAAPATGVATTPGTGAPVAALTSGKAAPADGRRVVNAVAGGLVGLVSLGFLGGGTALLVLEQTARESNGFVMSDTSRVTAPGHAVLFEDIQLDAPANDWVPSRIFGDVVVIVTTPEAGPAAFVGVAPQREVDSYLSGVARTVYGAPNRVEGDLPGSAAPSAPTNVRIWSASATGSGTQELRWTPTNGQWAGVVMNADGSAGVTADVAVGATFPWLVRTAVALLVVGGVLALIGAALVTVAVRPSRSPNG